MSLCSFFSQDIGIKVLTNADIKKPSTCLNPFQEKQGKQFPQLYFHFHMKHVCKYVEFLLFKAVYCSPLAGFQL